MGRIRHNKTDIISWLLVLSLLFSMMPGAFATDGIPEKNLTEELAGDAVLADPVDDTSGNGEGTDAVSFTDADADTGDEPGGTPAEEPGEDSGNEEPDNTAGETASDGSGTDGTGTNSVNEPADDAGTVEDVEKTDGEPAESGSDENPAGADADQAGEDAGINDEESDAGDGDAEDEEDENALPYGFAGMPEGYELSEAELHAKASLREHGLPESLDDYDYAEDRLLLMTSDPDYAALVAEAYCAELVGFYGSFAELHLTDATVAQAVTAATDPDVPLPAVEPDWTVTVDPGSSLLASGGLFSAQSVADDPYEWDDWVTSLGLNDPLVQEPAKSSFQWMHEAVNSYAAWGVTMGGSGVRIAVLDTGLDTGHEDLGLISPGANTIGTSTTTDVSDDTGHGTHVAGIIGMQGFNGVGGVGIAPGVTILPVRVMSSNSGSTSSLIRGINWAVEQGVDIINMSLGGTGYSTGVVEAIGSAYTAGITVFAAMSNNYYGGSNIPYYPAAYDHVIAVGATDRSGNRASYSHYGTWCDVYAPGSGIWSCGLNSSYRSDSGTSMACPVAAGIAALYMSAYGNPGPDAMARVLKNATGSNGVLDASRLFSADLSAPVFTAAEPDGTEAAISGNTVELTSAGKVYAEAASQDNGSRILYTLDGKKPSMLNGEVRTGTLLPVGEGIPLADYSVGQTVTVTAVRVSGLGIAGKTATLKVKIVTPPAEEETELVSVEITDLPQNYMVAGRTWQLRGTVTSSSGTAVDQKLSWSIAEQTDGLGAAVSEKTGLLTTKAGKSGMVRVRAVPAAYPENAGAEAVIVVTVVPLTKTITLTVQDFVARSTSVTMTATCRDSSGNILDNDDVGLKWTSSNTKVATVDENGVISAIGRGTVTIRVTAQDGSGKSAGKKLTIQERVTGITLSCQEIIAPGASATVKAAVTPSNANNKSVTWKIQNCSEENADIRVSSSGKVTVGKSVPAGTTFEVVATAKDGSGTESEGLQILVMPRATSVTLLPDEDPLLPVIGKGKLTGAILYRLELPEVARADGTVRANNTISLSAWRNYGSGDSAGSDSLAITWSSGNKKAATVDAEGNVTAVAAGTAVITARANDGSGKTAKFTVKVINPVSSLNLISAAPLNCEMLAYGKSVKTAAALGNTYGKPGITALRWSFEAWDDYGNDVTELMTARKLVSLSSSGKLTVKAGARNYGLQEVAVSAATTDGTGLSDFITYSIVEGTTKVRILGFSADDTVKTTYLPVKGSTTLRIVGDGVCDEFTVSSGNPKVAGAIVTARGTYTDSSGVRRHYAGLSITAGIKTGTAKITVRACDGTGKSATVTVKVSG